MRTSPEIDHKLLFTAASELLVLNTYLVYNTQGPLCTSSWNFRHVLPAVQCIQYCSKQNEQQWLNVLHSCYVLNIMKVSEVKWHILVSQTPSNFDIRRDVTSGRLHIFKWVTVKRACFATIAYTSHTSFMVHLRYTIYRK